MAYPTPTLETVASEWEDGETDFGWDGEISPNLTLYLLGVKHDEYNIRREEDGDEQEVDQWAYKLYNPEELSVHDYERMQDDGWRFFEVDAHYLFRMFDGAFDHRRMPG